MAVLMQGNPIDSISFKLIHTPSGFSVNTTPPIDNGGDGTSFSPTDLCAVSLGACAATIMGLYAKKKGFSLLVSFNVKKEMQPSPRRIGVLSVSYTLDTDCSDEEYEVLKRLTQTCPVRLSLHPDVQVSETFLRKDQAV